MNEDNDEKTFKSKQQYIIRDKFNIVQTKAQ
jgi:hypothetical protein